MSQKYPGKHVANDDHSGVQPRPGAPGRKRVGTDAATRRSDRPADAREANARMLETAVVSRGASRSGPVDAMAATLAPGADSAPDAASAVTAHSSSGRAGSDPPLPAAGDQVGRYQLIRVLGHGGMGTVFLARDTRLGRLVAIKFLRTSAPGMNDRFIAEAQTTAQCQHENIVILYEADEHENQPYLALEYLQGQSLAQLIGQVNTDVSENAVVLPVARAVELIVPVLRALARAHDMGIVHRDLKPGNIMLTDSGVIKVLDFGVAKVLAEAAEQTARAWFPVGGVSLEQTQGMVGTPPYMAPEQLAGQPVDARADIWAVGIILHKMVTGRHPLAPLSVEAVTQVSKLDIPMPRVRERWPDLGPLADIIDRCLIKPVEDRIDSAQTLIDELTPLLPGREGAALAEDESPFAGLSAFQEADADRFFGRSTDVRNLVARVRSQPLTAVTGPSGVGKSSIIRAGVIPTLKRSGEGWDAVTLRPGRKPLDVLIDVLDLKYLQYSTRTTLQTNQPLGGTSSLSSSSGSPSNTSSGPASEDAGATIKAALEDRLVLTERLIEQPGYLGTELRTWAQRKRRRLIIFVDQFEELYTATADATERAAFLACLSAVADDASSPLRVILSIRSDFLERMLEDPSFMIAATRGLVFLSPMDRNGLRDALTGPVRAVNHRFESQTMVDDMLDELQAASGALPLMQFTASQLWTARDRERRVLTEASYQALGGIAGTLARHADRVLEGLSIAQIRLARAIFERLVTPERTRAIISVEELRSLPGTVADIDNLVQKLTSARLLVVETGGVSDLTSSSLARAVDSERVMIELVHESLIESWPTLGRWLDENQEDAAFLARLRTAANEWHKGGRAEGMLWRGAAARDARRWYEDYTGQLGQREGDFLDAVGALAGRVQRRRRTAVAAVIAVLSVLLLIAGVGIIQIQKARRVAEASERAAMADKARAEQATVAAERAETQARAAEMQARKSEAQARASEAQARRDKQRALEAIEAEVAAEGQARDKAEEARLSREEALSALQAARTAEKRAKAARASAEANATKLQKTNARLQRILQEKEALLRKHRIEKPILER